MIERETISLSVADVQELITSAHIERQPSGQWTMILVFDGQCKIDETRTLPVNREVRIGKLIQQGRRPLPVHVQESLKKGLRNSGLMANKK